MRATVAPYRNPEDLPDMDLKALELILGTLGNANDGQLTDAFTALRALEDAKVAEAQAATTAADKRGKLEELTAIRAQQKTIVDEVALRQEVASGIQSIESGRIELPVASTEEPAEGEGAPAEGAPAEGEGAPAEGAPAEGAPAEGAPAEGTEGAAPAEKVLAGVTAGAVDAARPAQTAAAQGAGGEAAPSRARRPFVSTGFSTSTMGEGTELADSAAWAKVATAAYTRIAEAIQRGGNPNDIEEITIARVAALSDMDPAGMLGEHHSAKRNTELMHEAVYIFRDLRDGVAVPAMTAAPCLPLNKVAEIVGVGDDTDWLDGLIPRRNAIGSNIGFQFNRDLALDTVTGGVGVLDYADIDAIDPTNEATWKPCATIVCPDVVTAVSHEVTGCLTLPVMQILSRPEWTDRAAVKLRIALARARIQKKLDLVDAVSKGYAHVDVAGVGAKWTVIDGLLRLLRAGRYDERLADQQALVIVPAELVDIMYLDEAAKANEREQLLADFEQILSARVNVRLVEMGPENGLDDPGIVQANGNFYPVMPADGTTGNEIPARPCELRARIWYPESLVQWTTGESNVAFGAVEERLYRTNRVQMFQREYSGIAKLGSQPLMFADFSGFEFGVRSGLVTAPTCENAAS